MHVLTLILVVLVYLEPWVVSGKSSGKVQIITGCRDHKHLALTFDDGIGHYTEGLLDVLRRNGVKATFFLLGQTLGTDNPRSQAHQKIVRRMVREGHIVGSHTWDHPDLRDLSKEEIQSQMKRTDAVIKEAIGVRPRLFRPPFGYIDTRVARILAAEGYLVITWNQDTNDWRHQGSSDTIIDFVQHDIPRPHHEREGPIILQHDTLKTATKLQSRIIRILRKKGYQFVTLYECIGEKPYRY
jgi:peptidoglycan/xylan/chitin deacetylase (PgdA/CDA1 family)